MKYINVAFEDKEMNEIEKIKKSYNLSWHDFILDCIRNNLEKEIENEN